MRATIVCLVIVLGAFETAFAEQAAGKQAVVFSATGGTSKGSYQGGGDWVVSEFLRRQRADPVFRARIGLGIELDLKAVTGASAGNVNALVAAIAWCTKSLGKTEAIAAEDSLFWTFWVNTGIDQLIPPDGRKNSEPAVFDRSFFMVEQKNALDLFVRTADVWPNCALPVGITMTKQTPVEISLSTTGSVTRVQRFAAVFEARTATGTLQVEPPSGSLPKAGGLGALALPPGEFACSEEPHGLNWAYNVMIASSSFPVAFAPRRVCYESGGLARDGVQRALFADGGVFDNNPAGLALGLADQRSLDHSKALESVDVIYTTGSNVRGFLKEARELAAPQQDLLGLAATRQLLSGGISAARENEIQTLMRQRSRDQDLLNLGRKAEFFPSSRSGEIVGETLAGFGAFLGKEFREYDFYSGIYDGLDLMSKYVCFRKQPCDPTELVTEWIGTNLLSLSDEATLVVKWRQALEQSPGVAMRRVDWEKQLTTTRRKLLFAIHSQVSNLAARRSEIGARSCAMRNDIVGGFLCAGGLDLVLAGLKEDTLVKAVREASTPEADPAFLALLRAPETHVNSLIEAAMNRLHAAEEDLQTVQADYGAWVETALLFYRGQSYRYRKGLKWNPSSGRVDFRNLKSSAASVANIVFPNYVTLGVGRSDLYTLGWRPLAWRPRQSVYVDSVLEFFNLEGKRVSWRQNGVGITLGTYALSLPMVSSVELGVLSRGMDGPRRETFISTSLRFLADKVHFNVRMKADRPRTVYVNLGISDVNGLVFWLIR